MQNEEKKAISMDERRTGAKPRITPEMVNLMIVTTGELMLEQFPENDTLPIEHVKKILHIANTSVTKLECALRVLREQGLSDEEIDERLIAQKDGIERDLIRPGMLGGFLEEMTKED